MWPGTENKKKEEDEEKQALKGKHLTRWWKERSVMSDIKTQSPIPLWSTAEHHLVSVRPLTAETHEWTGNKSAVPQFLLVHWREPWVRIKGHGSVLGTSQPATWDTDHAPHSLGPYFLIYRIRGWCIQIRVAQNEFVRILVPQVIE